MWCLVLSVVVWYLLFTFQIIIWLLLIICPFCTFSMLHFMLPSSTFSCPSIFSSSINLTATIKMVISEVLTMILPCPHMLCQPLFRRVCPVALTTIKLQILHSQSQNRNFRNYDGIPQFLRISSILSRFSFFYWLSCNFIDIHCFFRAILLLQSYSGCSSPLPPPQSSSARSPPWAPVTPVNWLMGAVPRYWGCLTSIALKQFPHMSHLKVTLG